MQRYIEHLIEDLEEAANNPPAASFIEPPLHLEEDQETSELALVPFKSIEEWTGIKQEVFPEINELQGDQWGKVNEAIIKVFESLKLELVDVPPEIPPEWLYEVLSTNWNHPVQYLPSSGMDLELCTGDPMTCPYGEYCTCGDDLIEDDIPERFKKVIPEIAQSIDAGFVCFLNPETMEIEEIRQRAIDDPEEYEAITGVILENEEYKHQDWDSVFEFEPLDSNESFRIMEAFTAKLSDKAIQNRLIYALNHRKPFANFKSIIDNSIFRQDWFNFKQHWLENMLCHLNRNDQKDDGDFTCDSFEKI
jgi:hypothetical protein